jgi:predicted aspartyl protease
MNLLTFEYDTNYRPAAPFVTIEVDGYSASGSRGTLWAMVDSGADATMLPVRVLEAVEATYKETMWMHGTAGGRIEVDLYFVAVRIGSIRIPGLHVIATPSAHEAIVGRDILNQLVMTLNDHASTTEILLD